MWVNGYDERNGIPVSYTHLDVYKRQERHVAGVEIRVWYSYNPDELCGIYWLMKQLQPLNCQTTIYLVKLPTWDYGKANTMTSKIAWGEVSPGEWGNYITLQEKANPDVYKRQACSGGTSATGKATLRAVSQTPSWRKKSPYI